MGYSKRRRPAIHLSHGSPAPHSPEELKLKDPLENPGRGLSGAQILAKTQASCNSIAKVDKLMRSKTALADSQGRPWTNGLLTRAFVFDKFIVSV
jgi:hypothetical protein